MGTINRALAGLVFCAGIAAARPAACEDARVIPNQQARVEAAIAAMDRGDNRQAFDLFLALARDGDDKAASTAGWMAQDGIGVPQDLKLALDLYVGAWPRDGDVLNNLGVMARDGKGLPQNPRIAFLLFLIVHMAMMGDEETQIRTNSNLRRMIDSMSEEDRHAALCYTTDYLDAWVLGRGAPEKAPKDFPVSRSNIRFRDASWWAPGELEEFKCQ